MKYKTNSLNCLADIQTGPFGSQLHNEDYVLEGTPIVTVEHLGEKNFKQQNLPYVSDADKERLSKYVLKTGDIVFSRVGSVDRCSYVSAKYDGWLFSGRCLRVRPNETLDPQYLYYYFCAEETKQFVRNIAVGATMPSINTALLGQVQISYPDIITQKKIAAILSALDEKIAINREINDNLEQQAVTLVAEYAERTPYSSAFSDIMNFDNGFAFQSSTYLSNGKYKIITIKNVQDGYIDSTGSAFIDSLPQRMKDNCILNIGDVLLSLTGNVGRVGVVCEENLLLNQRVAKIVPYDNKLLPFLYFVFRQSGTKTRLETIAKGTAQLNLSPIETLKLTIPYEESSAIQLSQLLEPLYRKIINNNQESCFFALLRDTLLPKLMSGEIDVSAV